VSTRILVVEDNWESLELMRYLLKAQGHQVFVAAGGAAAVEIAPRERPDLILCDVQMPDVDGYEVLRRLRANPALAHVPVVAVTALSASDDRHQIAQAGFDGFLPKPIAPESFVEEALSHLHARLHLQGRGIPAVPAQAAGGSGKSILVVDDLQSNLELAEIVLKHLGYGVALARGMQMALQQMRQQQPDLVLSDLRMEGGDGYELLSQVRSDWALRAIPFILISSTSVADDERDHGFALGADRFLTRPIAPHSLRDEIEASIRERLRA